MLPATNRVFVIGNGPSLKDTDLTKLDGETTFACNNIHLIYPYTDWRPTHYVRAEQADALEEEHWIDSMRVHLEMDCHIYCNEWFLKPQHNLERRPGITIIRSCAHYGVNFDQHHAPHLWHLPNLCTFGSTVNVAVQLAVIKHYDFVYLVGCDLGYEDGAPSHFVDDYEHGREQPARYANSNALAAHMVAARSSPIPIYNATKGGILNVFPRVDYDALF